MLALLTHAEHTGTDAFWGKRGDAAPPGPGRLQRVEWHIIMLSRYLAALCNRDRVAWCRQQTRRIDSMRAGRQLLGHVQAMYCTITLPRFHGPNETGDGGDVRVGLWSAHQPFRLAL
jgi:hypothetical protein